MAFLASPSGSSARRFGVPIAWNIDEDICCSLATHPWLSIFELSSSEDNADADDFASHRHSSNIEHPIKGDISQIHAYPEIRPPSHQKRSPSDHSDSDSSRGSDWGTKYPPNRFGESSSD